MTTCENRPLSTQSKFYVPEKLLENPWKKKEANLGDYDICLISYGCLMADLTRSAVHEKGPWTNV